MVQIRRSRKQRTEAAIAFALARRWEEAAAENRSLVDEFPDDIEAANRLGKALKELGMTLAYHNHDPEMRASAREFHHMMAGTDPALVKLCLDAHWIYRGAGNSQVALFDIVKLYGARVAELHLRQSRGGVWAEDFGEGDLDYPRLAAALRALKLHPHVVLEQAVEQGTPKTLDPVEAHRRSAAYARPLLEGIGAK